MSTVALFRQQEFTDKLKYMSNFNIVVVWTAAQQDDA